MTFIVYRRRRSLSSKTGKPDVSQGTGAAGRAQLYADNKLVAQGDIPLTIPITIGLAGGIVCGADPGSPVWDKYNHRSSSPARSTE